MREGNAIMAGATPIDNDRRAHLERRAFKSAHSMTPFLIEITTMKSLYRIAFGLAVLTIVCSGAEGLVSTYFGHEDQSLTLFGFGADSFIEMISGFGIAHMILRIQRRPDSNRDNFERTALLINGFAFFALAIGLVTSSIWTLWTGHKPTTTIAGVVIAVLSMVAMLALFHEKIRVGRQLDSDAILADAECTRICIYMSLVLLAASGFYELTKVTFIDSMGSIGLAYFSFKEGQECFAQAKSNKLCPGEDD